MPYMMMGKCVHKQNEDGTAGEVVKCHDTAAEAKAHMAALYANVEDAATKESMFVISEDAELSDAELQAIDALYQSVKAGRVALDSLPEPEAVTGKAQTFPRGGTPGGSSPGGNFGSSQGFHKDKQERCFMRVKKLGADDATARKVCHSMFGGRPGVKESSFTVYKQADGKFRWLAVTSSSFQDRDKEIVSQKALEQDAERMNASGDYGTLDWWHTPVVLGTCDFSAMHGRLSVESGTFKEAWVAEKLAEYPSGFEMSRAFMHPITEPDAQGVYHNIKTFSRAIIPGGKGKASNLLTTFAVVEKEKAMLTDKIKELKALFGGNKEASEKVDALLAEAEQKEKAATSAGIAAKEAPPESPAPAVKETPINEQPGMFVADMKPEEFDVHIAAAINAAVQPILVQLNALKEANAVAVKESSAGVLAAVMQEVKKLQDAQAATAAQVKDLNGLTPRGYRATQDPATITEKQTQGPGADEKTPYFADFVNKIIGATAAVQPPTR